MKRLIFFTALLYMTLASTAQNVIVEGISPNLYIAHTVVTKENFYSIGRLYNQLPKVIASSNNLVMEKGLSIGQRIKIPLNEQNLDAGDKINEGEVLVPVKHVVAKGENIFKLGTVYGVTAQSIRQWNLLSSDNLAQGASLVVGYLKVKTGESALASGKGVLKSQPIAAKPITPQVSKPTAPVKEEAVVVANTTPPANKKPEGDYSAPQPKETQVTIPKDEPVKKVIVEPKENKTTREVAANPISTPLSKPQEPDQSKVEKRKIDISTTAASTAEGAFASIFSNDPSHKSLNTKSGDAATFKSTSGWQDKKYYVLMNDITPGTIVKLQSGNSKVVYAKVLGSIPEMKENNGLLLRVSNAAASFLGLVDSRFPVQVNYYQ